MTAPGNRNESVLLKPALEKLVGIAKAVGLQIAGSIASFDGVYNYRKNRKSIFNLGMTPNMPENKRNRKKQKRGRKQIYDEAIFDERFSTI